jgi:hypothetical protein
MVMPRLAVAVAPVASVTRMPKVLVPALAGVPPSIPSVELLERAGGSKPMFVLQAPEQVVHVQLYGAVPPVACRVTL